MFTDLVAFKGCCIMHVGTRRHSDRPLLQQLRKSLPKCRSVKLKFNTFCKMDVHGATDSKHLQQFMQKKWLNTLKKKKQRKVDCSSNSQPKSGTLCMSGHSSPSRPITPPAESQPLLYWQKHSSSTFLKSTGVCKLQDFPERQEVVSACI